jgi:hypothetical protein
MAALHLPLSDNLSELELTYVAYERVVLGEFMSVASNALDVEFGQDGADVMYNRDDHSFMRINYSNPMDPLFLLGSYVNVFSSPLRTVLPFSQHHRSVAKTVKDNRNLWAHYQPPEQRTEILAAISMLKTFASLLEIVHAKAAGLAIEERLREIAATRARQIHGGTQPEPVLATTFPAPVEELEASNEKLPTRPRVGGAWTYPLPSTVLELNRAHRDVFDRKGESIVKKFGEPAELAVKRWLSMSINSWLYVDSRDGATVALVDGDAFLIGFLGGEPPLADAEYRGFFQRGLYENVDGQLLDVETRAILNSQTHDTSSITKAWVNDRVPVEASVRLTDYGHVVLVDDGGSRRIATLELLQNTE